MHRSVVRALVCPSGYKLYDCVTNIDFMWAVGSVQNRVGLFSDYVLFEVTALGFGFVRICRTVY